MADRKATLELRHRDRLAAILLAEGKLTMKDIAARCEISESRLRVLKNSPLFQQLVSEIDDRIVETGVQQVIENLMSDAPRNLAFIQRVRDGDEGDDANMLNTRLRAADLLWSRQVPKTDGNNADDGLKVVVSGGMLKQMMEAMQRGGYATPIDVTPTAHPRRAEDAMREVTARELIEDDED